MDTDLIKRITIDPNVMVGKPVIRGLRISVNQILKSLASGIEQDELLNEYPELEKEDILAALLYASNLIESEKIYPIAS